ncbi:zinc-dependent alcohol dehydrogenase [Crenalkalicoccus roseus]|uniref:zinc-dependent alcohol dehydrogenase n=1 Tax=Crenalkalicoccus roseus TaxID=1485588 RepID=UPI001081D444|nr:zinc-binding alcohol dehydrogenase [Crenalkalicoccus roseus]
MKARALWITGPRQAALREEALRPPAEGEALVRTLHSGLSRGTERLVFEGRVPESEHGRMRAPLQAGDFPFPVKYGYCAVGRIEAGPAHRIGETVFCLHPHQDLFLAPAAMCVPLPAGLPPSRAVLAANMETALNILWDARPLPGERALVIGAGVVGLLVVRLLARIPGMAVAVHDTDTRREALARAAGARFLPADALAPEHELVVHASGQPEGLRTALAACAFEARILEASWFGAREVALPLGEAFHARRLTLRSTQVGAVSPAMRGRRSHAERLALALSLLDDAWCDTLLGPPVPFAALPEALPRLLSGPDAPPCPLVTYI